MKTIAELTKMFSMCHSGVQPVVQLPDGGGPMTDPLPSDVRLLIAAGWTRHEPDDDGEPWWTRLGLPEPHYTTGTAAKTQLRAMGWQTISVPLVQHGVWRQPRNGGTAPSFSVACDWARETIEQQLRDHGKAPSSHGDAVSPPAPGADPPGEPEPAEGDSDPAVRLRQIAADIAGLSGTLATDKELCPIMAEARAVQAVAVELEHNARQDVIAAALALVDAWADDRPTREPLIEVEARLEKAVAGYRGER